MAPAERRLKTTSESKPYLKRRIGTENSVLPSPEVIQSNGFVCALIGSFCHPCRMEDGGKETAKRWQRLPKELCREIFCQVSCLFPALMHRSLHLQINQFALLSKTVNLLPCSYRSKGLPCRGGHEEGFLSSELHVGLQFLDLWVACRASSLWIISPWYVKASKAWLEEPVQSQHCSVHPFPMPFCTPDSALFPKDSTGTQAKTLDCIKAGSKQKVTLVEY